MVLYVVEIFELCISAVVPHFVIGLILSACFFGLFILAQGFFVLLRNLPAYWLGFHYIGMLTYSFRVFMKNEFMGLKFTTSNDPDVPTTWQTGEQVLAFYSLNKGSNGEDLAVLFVMAVLYAMFFYYILLTRHRGQR
jgi:ABC-type multidrug transport system permease subunit